MELLIAEEKAITVWTTYFLSSIAKQNWEVSFEANPEPGLSHGFEEIEMPSLDQFAKVDRDFQTPQKLKLSDMLAVDAETLPMPIKRPTNLKTFPVPENKSGKPTDYAAAQRLGIQTVLIEWDRVVEHFDLLFEEIGSLGIGEKKYRAALTQTIMRLQSGVGDANGRALILAARMGQDELASDQGSITVWEAIASMKEEVGNLSKPVATGRQEVLESSQTASDASAGAAVVATDLQALRTKFEVKRIRTSNLGTSFANLGRSYVAMVAKMKQLVADLETKVAGIMQGTFQQSGGAAGGSIPPVQTFGVTWGTGIGPAGGGTGSPTGQEFNELRAKVTAIETESTAMTQAGGLGVGGGSGVGSGGDPGIQIEKILTRLGDMESRVSDESIEMNETVFSSMNDVTVWCVATDVESCGMFWDIFSVLVVMPPKKQTGKERADESYSSHRIETTTFENDLGASMSHTRPAPLYGKNHGTGALAEL
jgi:hypothetical protein